jgi:hypothetical protein
MLFANKLRIEAPRPELSNRNSSNCSSDKKLVNKAIRSFSFGPFSQITRMIKSKTLGQACNRNRGN